MNFKISHQILLALCLTLLVPATSFGQCANKLLWSTGSVWVYRAVKCESKEVCNKPTGQVMFSKSEIEALGCASVDDECKCSNGEGGQLDIDPQKMFGLEVEPDQMVQNRGCQNIDAFVVKIDDNYFQLIEFRYVPDDTKTDGFGIAVARNMRTAIKLTGEPKNASSNLLVGDNAKLAGDNIVRTFGTTELTYPLLKSSTSELEELPAAAPVTPEPAATPAAPEPTPSATPEPDSATPTPDDSSDNGGQ